MSKVDRTRWIWSWLLQMPESRSMGVWPAQPFVRAGSLLAGAASATPPDVIIEPRVGEQTGRYATAFWANAIRVGQPANLTVDKCHGCEGTIDRTDHSPCPKSRVFEDIAAAPLADLTPMTCQGRCGRSDQTRRRGYRSMTRPGLFTAHPSLAPPQSLGWRSIRRWLIRR